MAEKRPPATLDEMRDIIAKFPGPGSRGRGSGSARAKRC